MRWFFHGGRHLSNLARSQHETLVPVIGRAGEMAHLLSALSSLHGGSGTAVFIEGEPGIGMSRLLGEVLEWAQSENFQVLGGFCEQLEQTRPFGPWVEALGCKPSSPDPHRAAIGRMLYPGEWTDPGNGPASGVEYRVVEALVDPVERMAAPRPLVIAIEDLHWSDSSSPVAFRALQRRLSGLPVGLLATLRPGPHSQALEILLGADDGAVHMRLAPLEDHEVAQLAEHILGTGVGKRLGKLLEGAAGNPQFVSELLKARPPTGWEALTATEQNVVKLVAQGLANREIASRLYLSHRTVETHITHVFQKLGFTSRSELVAQAVRRGL